MMSRILAAALLAVGLVGCGNDGRPKTVPVSGKVLVNGKAAEGVSLSFHPLNQPHNSVPGTARSRADGSFDVTSFLPGDGAPPGEYAVTVIWPDRYATDPGGQEYPVGDKLGGAYSRKDSTPIKVTIREGENHLDPFDLNHR